MHVDFYDALADDYEELTAAVDRQPAAGGFVEELMGRFHIASAVDAACGTGLYALELAKRGVEVVGSDISSGMLRSAARNASGAGIDDRRCSWVRAPMQELAAHVSGDRDAIVCMGNSIPHLLKDADLTSTVEGFASLLKGGGVAVIHLLNYARVLAAGERIVGITRGGSKQYVRFYDFGGELIDFNVLEIEWHEDGRCSHKLVTTPLRPYGPADLTGAFATGGFEDIRAFGDLQFNEFDPDTSDTLLLMATRKRP